MNEDEDRFGEKEPSFFIFVGYIREDMVMKMN